MKLRNKKTGEIVEFNEEWEAYKEFKDITYWYIDILGKVGFSTEILDEVVGTPNNILLLKSIGNYFETKKEAEKAVEKIKAWKRLKDLGFSFDGAYLNKDSCLIKTKIDKPVTFGDAEQFYCDFELIFGEIHESQS